MLEILGTVFGSIFSGGATGIIGVLVQRFADYKNKQLDLQLEAQKFSQQLELKKVDAEIMRQEYAAKQQIAVIETQGATDVADAVAFAASYTLDPKQYSNPSVMTPGQNWVMVLLDAFKGSIRPVLTLYLCTLTTLVYFQSRMLLSNEDIDAEKAMELTRMIVGSIIYLTTTCVLWWFGTRNKLKQG